MIRVLAHLAVCFCLLSVARSQFESFMEDGGESLSDDDEFVLEKWKLMESRAKSLTEEVVKMIMPNMTDFMVSLNLSRKCFRESTKVLLGLRKLSTWAVKFLDASTKAADGLLVPQVPSLGAYEECIYNEVFYERPESLKGKLMFRGKYCSVSMRLYLKMDKTAGILRNRNSFLQNAFPRESVFAEVAKLVPYMYYAPLKVGMCIPSGCSADDLNLILRKVSDYLGVIMKATRCDIKEEKKYSLLIIGIMTVYSLMGFLVLAGTLLDVFYFHYWKKEFSGTASQVLKAFSFMSNFKRLTATSTSEMKCLNGIRFLSMSWIILSHTYLIHIFLHHNLPLNLSSYTDELIFQVIINGTFAVDSFFFLSGFLVCYTTTKLVKINKKPFNVTFYVVHRLWRILPLYAFAIGFEFLIPLTGFGPVFNELSSAYAENCRKNWWANLLLIHNFYDEYNMCLSHTWYVATDTQLYIFALLILIPLMRWPKIGIGIAGFSILGGMVASAATSYLYNFPPVYILSESQRELGDFHRIQNMKPYFHIAPFCIGLLLGYLLANRADFQVRKSVQLLGWTASVAVCLSVIYAVRKWNSGFRPTVWENVGYSAFARPAWALGLAWVTFCCCTKHGGVVNYILSWNIWTPLARLTYAAYLAHLTVIIQFNVNARTSFYFQHYFLVWVFFGHLVVSYAIGFAASILVEAPCSSLEKIHLFGNPKSRNGSEEVKRSGISETNLEEKDIDFKNGMNACEKHSFNEENTNNGEELFKMS